MAAINIPAYNPVPFGVAGPGGNSGEALVYQGGDKPLATLMRLDATAEKNRRFDAQQKALRQQKDLDALANLRTNPLDVGGFMPFYGQLEEQRRQMIAESDKVAQDPLKPRHEKESYYAERASNRKAAIAWTDDVGKRFQEITRLSGADKRFDTPKVDASLYQKIKGPDGEVVKIGKLNPEELNTVLQDPANYNQEEVVKQFVANLPKQQMSVSTAARPGGTGRQTSTESNLFVYDEQGRPVLDPKTHQRILRTESPELLELVESDPFMKGVLDREQRKHEQMLDAMQAKMSAYEPLTDEERMVFGQEAAKPKVRKDFLNELLLPFAYERRSTAETYARPIVPRRAAAASATPPAPGRGGFGVESMQTATGSLDLPTTYSGAEPTLYAKDNTPKPVILRGSVFKDLHLQPPGQPMQHITNNTEAQDLQLKAPKLVLFGPQGQIYAPSKPEYGATAEALTAWYVGALRKNKNYRLGYAVQATPTKGENGLGSEEEYFQSLKSQYAQSASAAPAAKGNLSLLGTQATGKSRTPSDKELRETARKLYAKQGATYYLPYENDTKRKLDRATGAYLEQAPAMQAEVARIKRLVQQGQPGTRATGVDWAPAARPAATNSNSNTAAGKKSTGVKWR